MIIIITRLKPITSHAGLFEATDELAAKRTLESLQHAITLISEHFKDETRMGKCTPAHLVCDTMQAVLLMNWINFIEIVAINQLSFRFFFFFSADPDIDNYLVAFNPDPHQKIAQQLHFCQSISINTCLTCACIIDFFPNTIDGKMNHGLTNAISQKQHHDLTVIASAKLAAVKAGTEAVDDAFIHAVQNWFKNHIKVRDHEPRIHRRWLWLMTALRYSGVWQELRLVVRCMSIVNNNPRWGLFVNKNIKLNRRITVCNPSQLKRIYFFSSFVIFIHGHARTSALQKDQ